MSRGDGSPLWSANAQAEANDQSVLGVIRTFNSGCAKLEIPSFNRAPNGPLATVSPIRRSSLPVGDSGQAYDSDLIDRIADGDASAFTDLFDRYATTAMALARRVLGHGNLAEEVVQEGFLAVWRTPEGYRSERGSVRSWLLSIVHHRAVDLVRREESQRACSVRAAIGCVNEGPADPGDLVVRDVGLAEDQRRIQEALAALPPAQKQVIELMYFGGLSQSRISEYLSVPLGTVKSRTLLGMRRLRAALGDIERLGS